MRSGSRPTRLRKKSNCWPKTLSVAEVQTAASRRDHSFSQSCGPTLMGTPLMETGAFAVPGAISLDLFGFGMYTFSLEAAGTLSLHDPFEGTETGSSLPNS